jgi:hypothetical protein
LSQVAEKLLQIDLLEQIYKSVVRFGLADPFQVIHFLGEEKDNVIPGVVHPGTIIDRSTHSPMIFFVALTPRRLMDIMDGKFGA